MSGDPQLASASDSAHSHNHVDIILRIYQVCVRDPAFASCSSRAHSATRTVAGGQLRFVVLAISRFVHPSRSSDGVNWGHFAFGRKRSVQARHGLIIFLLLLVHRMVYRWCENATSRTCSWPMQQMRCLFKAKTSFCFSMVFFCQIVSVTLINCLGHPEFSIEFLRAMGTLRRQMWAVKHKIFALVHIAPAGTETLFLHPACSRCLKGKPTIACGMAAIFCHCNFFIAAGREASVKHDAAALNRFLVAFLLGEGVAAKWYH